MAVTTDTYGVPSGTVLRHLGSGSLFLGCSEASTNFPPLQGMSPEALWLATLKSQTQSQTARRHGRTGHRRRMKGPGAALIRAPRRRGHYRSGRMGTVTRADEGQTFS